MTASVYTLFQIISDFFGMFYIARLMNAFIHADNKKKNNLYQLLYFIDYFFSVDWKYSYL